MAKRFTLDIRMGNEAMQTGEDVADLLREAAFYIEQHDSGRGLFDVNGNRVGRFGYTSDAK